ncbi:hypothetical protein N3K66_007399 [Trichothecium roseum]|uniref:Uncharacterized protein n=1 Tax=Trichothecium roseum TaxID=47278 RepID=A0ACC0UTW7_9HYPO|nr:hypothetical protein N3K66_007399 [Trichothecium roseum]
MTPHQAAQGGTQPQLELPKDDISTTSNDAPPAYSPSTAHHHPAAAALLNRYAYLTRAAPQATILEGTLPSSGVDADADADVDGPSPISLRINTSVSISRNQNLVCLGDSPRQHAAAIARAVVEAFRESSCGGIPMIDEDGRPRPVNVEVEAGMTVEGTGNIIGTESVVLEVLRQRAAVRKRSHDEAPAAGGGGDDGGRGETSGPASKRRRESC